MERAVSAADGIALITRLSGTRFTFTVVAASTSASAWISSPVVAFVSSSPNAPPLPFMRLSRIACLRSPHEIDDAPASSRSSYS